MKFIFLLFIERFFLSLSLSPQAINLHMEIKLQIWENIQEII